MVAQELKSAGFKVYAAARRVDRMADLEKDSITPVALDLTRDGSIAACVNTILSREKSIDVLVNNAGYGSYGAIEDVPLEEGRRQFEVNLFGMARLIRLVTPTMREQHYEKIVNISSMGGKIWTKFGGWYHATKYAVEGLSDCLRMELQPFGIDVVVVEPGGIKTDRGLIAAENLKKRPEEGLRMTNFLIGRAYRDYLSAMGFCVEQVLKKAGLPEDLFARQAPCLGAEEYFRFRSPDARICLRRLSQYKPLIGALLCRVEETETALSVELVSARAGLELPEILVGIEFVFLVGLIRKATQEPVTPLSAAARQPVKDPAYAEFLGVPITQGGQDQLVSAGVFRVDGRVRQQKPSAGCLTALPFVGSTPSIRLLGGEAEPAGGLMDLDPAEAGLLQQPLQLGGGVDPHAGDLFCPRLVPGRVAAAFVADEKRAAGAQHAADLAEAFWQVRPEIDRLKRRDGVEPVRGKDQLVHAPLPYGAAAVRDGAAVDAPRRRDAHVRNINALDDALRAFFQERADVCPAAAAAVEDLCVRRKQQEPHAPARQRAVADVHHADHELAAQPDRAAGIFQK